MRAEPCTTATPSSSKERRDEILVRAAGGRDIFRDYS